MKKGDVGIAKRFSKKYGNKGWAFSYIPAIWKLCQDACWTQKKLNRTLAINSPFQTFMVGLLVEFI